MTKKELKQLIREVIKEANTKELQKLGFTPTKSYIKEASGYVFGPMDSARSWISKHQAPKTKNGRQIYVVSAAAFQQAFPNIKTVPIDVNKISPRMDYFVIDKEGDLMPVSQADIGSGLD